MTWRRTARAGAAHYSIGARDANRTRLRGALAYRFSSTVTAASFRLRKGGVNGAS